MIYLVYGVDAKGDLHEVARKKSAREARTIRDAGKSPWAKTIVFGADGELTVVELNRLADMNHQYA